MVGVYGLYWLVLCINLLREFLFEWGCVVLWVDNWVLIFNNLV